MKTSQTISKFNVLKLSILVILIHAASAQPARINISELIENLEKGETIELRVSAARKLLDWLDQPAVQAAYKKNIDKISVQAPSEIRGDLEPYYPLAEFLGCSPSSIEWQVEQYLAEQDPQKMLIWQRALEVAMQHNVDVKSILRLKIQNMDLSSRKRTEGILASVLGNPSLSTDSPAVLATEINLIEASTKAYANGTTPFSPYPQENNHISQNVTGDNAKPNLIPEDFPHKDKIATTSKSPMDFDSSLISEMALGAFMLILLLGWAFHRLKSRKSG